MRFDIAVAIGAITTSFAINSVITRYVVLGGYGSPFALTVVRFVSGLVVLIALSVFMPRTFPSSKTNEKKSASYFFGAAFLGAYAFAISYGYLYISAAAGTFTFYASTLSTMSLLSYFEDRDKVILHRVFGQLLAFLGVTLITFSGIRAVTPLGVLLLVITGVSWGCYSQYGRGFSNPFGYTYNSFLIFGIASIVLSILVYLFFISSSVNPIWIQFSLNGLGLALYMGMISTALSYVLWSRVLKRIKGYQGGVVQLIVPVLAGLMGVFLLHEQISPLLVIGGATILAGIYLNAV